MDTTRLVMPSPADLIAVAQELLDLAKQGADQRAMPDEMADVRLLTAEHELDELVAWFEGRRKDPDAVPYPDSDFKVVVFRDSTPGFTMRVIHLPTGLVEHRTGHNERKEFVDATAAVMERIGRDHPTYPGYGPLDTRSTSG